MKKWNQGPRRRARSTRLRIERLERREMLAADTQALYHNQLDAEDVNGDGECSPLDALLIVNQLSTRQNSKGRQFLDVNADGRATALDALLVINRLHRGHGGGSGGGHNASPTFGNAQRSFDGTGNNVDQPLWGSIDQPLVRVAEADYADGISTPAGADRPSAREISNALAAQGDETGPSDRDLSALVYLWGQFLDHDLGLTVPQVGEVETFPISVPTGDPFFDPDGTATQFIPLTRSQFDPNTGTDLDHPRQQVTSVTSWIDASMIYGSDQSTADSLRTFAGGKLKTSDNDLLPVDDDGNFVAGDIRANENIELSSMHTLFVREHNRVADELALDQRGWTDEQLYQRARAIVAAEIQAITYNEFLPALLGRQALSPYRGYDASVDPSISNEFSTAGFRLGHSLINDDVEFFGNDGRAVREQVALRDAFMNPDLLRETGIDPILKYAASTNAQEIDTQIVDGLRNFLFGSPGQGGLDLAALNIQRGRDHGLADYNTTREAYGLERVSSFDQITSDAQLQATLREVYGSVDDIDLWVGALAEDHVPGSSTGELTRAILVDQFERLRDGDRFWYQNAFSGQEFRQMEQTSLSDVIRRNTTITNLQGNVMVFSVEIQGKVFVDSQGRGRHGRHERGASGVTLELLNEEGVVIETTVTDAQGGYRFQEIHETGDYRVRIPSQPGVSTTHVSSQQVFVSRGGLRIRGLDFVVRPT